MSAKHVKQESDSSAAQSAATTRSAVAAQSAPTQAAAQKGAVTTVTPAAKDFFSSDNTAYDMPRSRKTLKIVGIVIGVIVGLLAALYLAGVIFFSGHFLPDTTINGVDVSWKTPEETHDAIAATLDDYQLDIAGYTYQVTLVGKDIAYGLDSNQDMLADVNPWAWPAELVTHAGKTTTFAVSYNEETVNRILTETIDAHNETATAPVDAHLEYDKDTDTVVVSPEQIGTKLDKTQVSTDVAAALHLVSSHLDLTQRDLVAPAVFSTDPRLNNAAKQINTQWNVNVTLTLGGYPALTINKSNLLGWVTYDENNNVSLDNDAIEQWAQEKAEKLNTYGTEHTYIRPDGKEITVTGDTAFGWQLDTGALTETIVSAIKNGEQGEIAIPCTNEGAYYNMETGAEWTSFVDVDLSEQHAYYYNDSGELLWESDIISGNVNYATRATPTGVFAITRKATNERLYTYEEGKEKPNECTVAYWMPFIGNVYALHDAWWQPGFGGTMYRDGYGSHGCVNLPSDKAAELFNLVEVGTVVVVHW